LYSQHREPDNSDQKYHLSRHLIGYRIEVNGIRQRSLNATENFCSLTKCKPSNTYNIVVVAVTCLSSALDSASSLTENEIDVGLMDESFSSPLQVKLFQSDHPNKLVSLKARFEDNIDANEPASVGRLKIEWALAGGAAEDLNEISQFNVNWFSAEEALTQRKSLDSFARQCHVPVTKSK
jgi:hypothetical protein